MTAEQPARAIFRHKHVSPGGHEQVICRAMADQKPTHTQKIHTTRRYVVSSAIKRPGDRRSKPTRLTAARQRHACAGRPRTALRPATVRAALDNPARKIKRMLVTKNALDRLEITNTDALPFDVDIVEPRRPSTRRPARRRSIRA